MLVRLYQTAVLQGRTAYHIMKNRYLCISKAKINIYVYVSLHSVLIVNVWSLLPECYLFNYIVNGILAVYE